MILVTGATGFVGSALVARLAQDGTETRACIRRTDAVVPSGVQVTRVTGLTADADWSGSLARVDVVVHAAARVHVLNETAHDPLAEFRRVNVEGTLSLARQSAAAGVRRFIFISSIKVNGESTELGAPITAAHAPAPMDPYGVSKMEAEQGLRRLASQTGLEVVILRPPLVYGPGVQANFLTMMRLLARGAPLPLGAIDNRRSLVGIDNLVDLIMVCREHPAAAEQTFMVSDGEDVSTTQLLRRLGEALNKPARLFPVPAALLKIGAAMVGKPAIVQRLCGSLQVDIEKTRKLLGWKPTVSLDEGLRKVAEAYLRESSH